jgi:hypothetical protein
MPWRDNVEEGGNTAIAGTSYPATWGDGRRGGERTPRSPARRADYLALGRAGRRLRLSEPR